MKITFISYHHYSFEATHALGHIIHEKTLCICVNEKDRT